MPWPLSGGGGDDHSVFRALNGIAHHQKGEQSCGFHPLAGQVGPTFVLALNPFEVPLVNLCLKPVQVTRCFLQRSKLPMMNQLRELIPDGDSWRRDNFIFEDCIRKATGYSQVEECSGCVAENVDHVMHGPKIEWAA